MYDASNKAANLFQTEDCDTSFLLPRPVDTKPMHRLYGSTKHLFVKQKSVDLGEEVPVGLSVPTHQVEINLTPESKLPKHDSQESVQRIISERRLLDDNLKEVGRHDIYEVRHASDENLVGEKGESEKFDEGD